LPVVATVSKTRLDLLEPALPSFSDAAVTRIAVSGANSYILARDEQPDPLTKKHLWRFVEPAAQKGRVADSDKVVEMVNLLATSQGSFGKFIDENPTNTVLADYGLAPPRLKIVVSIDGKSENDRGFEFGKDTADPDKVYARVVGRTPVFTIQRRVLDMFTAPDLRDRVVFRAIPLAEVNSLELTGWGGITLKFEKNKDGVWVSQPPTPPAFVVDPAKVTAFITALATKPVKTFEKGAPEPKHGFGDPKQSLTARVKWPGGEAYVNLAASPDGGASYYGWTTSLAPPDQIFTIDAAPFKSFKDSSGGFAK
jgi:hypothetical protein